MLSTRLIRHLPRTDGPPGARRVALIIASGRSGGAAQQTNLLQRCGLDFVQVRNFAEAFTFLATNLRDVRVVLFDFDYAEDLADDDVVKIIRSHEETPWVALTRDADASRVMRHRLPGVPALPRTSPEERLREIVTAIVGTSPAPEPPPAPTPPPAPPLQEIPEGLSILIAEDDNALLEGLTAWLVKKNARVTGTRDGKAARDIMDRHAAQFDLLITDLNLPGVIGGLLLLRWRQVSGGKPAIAISGDQPGLEAIIDRNNSVVALVKPFPFELLDRAMIRALTGSSASSSSTGGG